MPSLGYTYSLAITQGGAYQTTLNGQQSWSSGGLTTDTTFTLQASATHHWEGSQGEGSGGEGSGGEGGG